MNDRWKTTFKGNKMTISPVINELNEYINKSSLKIMEHIHRSEEQLILQNFSFDELLRIKDCIQKEINQRNIDKAGLKNPNYGDDCNGKIK